MLTVRPEQPQDCAAIRDVHASCFATLSEARLVEALRLAGRLSASLVAAEDALIVGHLAFSPLELPDAAQGWGLGPIAVLPTHRRRGVAAMLVAEGLSFAVRQGAGFVLVLGDPGYYGKFGFLPARRWNVVGEYGETDSFQLLELMPGAIPPRGGLARYAAEFAALGV